MDHKRPIKTGPHWSGPVFLSLRIKVDWSGSQSFQKKGKTTSQTGLTNTIPLSFLSILCCSEYFKWWQVWQPWICDNNTINITHKYNIVENIWWKLIYCFENKSHGYLQVYLSTWKLKPGSSRICACRWPGSAGHDTHRYSHGFTCRLPVWTCTHAQP